MRNEGGGGREPWDWVGHDEDDRVTPKAAATGRASPARITFSDQAWSAPQSAMQHSVQTLQTKLRSATEICVSIVVVPGMCDEGDSPPGAEEMWSWLEGIDDPDIQMEAANVLEMEGKWSWLEKVDDARIQANAVMNIIGALRNTNQPSLELKKLRTNLEDCESALHAMVGQTSRERACQTLCLMINTSQQI